MWSALMALPHSFEEWHSGRCTRVAPMSARAGHRLPTTQPDAQASLTVDVRPTCGSAKFSHLWMAGFHPLLPMYA